MLRMADALRKHAQYLEDQTNNVSERNRKVARVDEYEWEVYTGKKITNPTTYARYKNVNYIILQSDPMSPSFLMNMLQMMPEDGMNF